MDWKPFKLASNRKVRYMTYLRTIPNLIFMTNLGLAAPLLIAGIATSSVGAATNIGTSLIERIINSKQVGFVVKDELLF